MTEPGGGGDVRGSGGARRARRQQRRRQHVQDRYVIDHLVRELISDPRRDGPGDGCRRPRRFGVRRGRVLQDALRKALNRAAAGGLPEF